MHHSDTEARLGGDEFVVLLLVMEGSADALSVAKKIRRTLREIFEVDGNFAHIFTQDGWTNLHLPTVQMLPCTRRRRIGAMVHVSR
jgi:GGDEF domain-containing protein